MHFVSDIITADGADPSQGFGLRQPAVFCHRVGGQPMPGIAKGYLLSRMATTIPPTNVRGDGRIAYGP